MVVAVEFVPKKSKKNWRDLKICFLVILKSFWFEFWKTCGLQKQAGTGPSRRHIQGSKIAKRLPSVKYSFTVLENRNFLKKNFRKNYILKKMDRVARRAFSTSILSQNMKKKQAGTGPSRRHIQGSKIAKRLPSVKYSFTVLENRKFFENFFFEKITY